MKRTLVASLSVIFILITVLPVCASATGGVAVIEGDNVYHSMFCDCVQGQYLDDLAWFDTPRKAESAGYIPCEECEPSDSPVFSPDGAIHWFSNDNKITCALEMERVYGIVDGYEVGVENQEEDSTEVSGTYDAGYDDGYDVGYDSGHDSGYDLGYTEGYQARHDEEVKSENQDLVYLFIIVTAAAVTAYWVGKRSTGENLEKGLAKCKAENERLQHEVDKNAYTIHMLNIVSEGTQCQPETILESLYISYNKRAGISEEDTRKIIREKKQLFLQNQKRTT